MIIKNITKNWFLEAGYHKWGSDAKFCCEFNIRRKGDHRGLHSYIAYKNHIIEFNIYDTRHEDSY
jgi:hypothetical protein